jgi:Multicopper oxidase
LIFLSIFEASCNDFITINQDDEMFKSPAVAMSNTENTRSLLSHDDDLGALRWKQDIAARHLKNGRKRISAFAVTLLFLPLTIFFILYLQWRSAFGIPAGKLNEYTGPIAVAGPGRDLKLLLHPEDHVSRDPSGRHFSWNITKATVAPNGVRKEVFLINSKIQAHLILALEKRLTMEDQFPGPTIEARSGDILEIEVFDFSEEEVSLHWHGLHMRGIYTAIL